MTFGKVYLIPTPISRAASKDLVPPENLKIIRSIHHFAVENLRPAVSFLQWIDHPTPEFELKFYELNKRTKDLDIHEIIQFVLNGYDVGIITDAGCPGVADPGSKLVQSAHNFDIDVIPLIGPASPVLALMASGLNGQNFSFHGYLPNKAKAREERIKELELRSSAEESAHFFIETPHRNVETYKALLSTLSNDTSLCISADITGPAQFNRTKEVSEWKPIKPPIIDKIPVIFGFQAKISKPVNLSGKKAVKKKFGR